MQDSNSNANSWFNKASSWLKSVNIPEGSLQQLSVFSKSVPISDIKQMGHNQLVNLQQNLPTNLADSFSKLSDTVSTGVNQIANSENVTEISSKLRSMKVNEAVPMISAAVESAQKSISQDARFTNTIAAVLDFTAPVVTTLTSTVQDAFQSITVSVKDVSPENVPFQIIIADSPVGTGISWSAAVEDILKENSITCAVNLNTNSVIYGSLNIDCYEECPYGTPVSIPLKPYLALLYKLSDFLDHTNDVAPLTLLQLDSSMNSEFLKNDEINQNRAIILHSSILWIRPLTIAAGLSLLHGISDSAEEAIESICKASNIMSNELPPSSTRLVKLTNTLTNNNSIFEQREIILSSIQLQMDSPCIARDYNGSSCINTLQIVLHCGNTKVWATEEKSYKKIQEFNAALEAVLTEDVLVRVVTKRYRWKFGDSFTPIEESRNDKFDNSTETQKNKFNLSNSSENIGPTFQPTYDDLELVNPKRLSGRLIQISNLDTLYTTVFNVSSVTNLPVTIALDSAQMPSPGEITINGEIRPVSPNSRDDELYTTIKKCCSKRSILKELHNNIKDEVVEKETNFSNSRSQSSDIYSTNNTYGVLTPRENCTTGITSEINPAEKNTSQTSNFPTSVNKVTTNSSFSPSDNKTIENEKLIETSKNNQHDTIEDPSIEDKNNFFSFFDMTDEDIPASAQSTHGTTTNMNNMSEQNKPILTQFINKTVPAMKKMAQENSHAFTQMAQDSVPNITKVAEETYSDLTKIAEDAVPNITKVAEETYSDLTKIAEDAVPMMKKMEQDSVPNVTEITDITGNSSTNKAELDDFWNFEDIPHIQDKTALVTKENIKPKSTVEPLNKENPFEDMNKLEISTKNVDNDVDEFLNILGGTEATSHPQTKDIQGLLDDLEDLEKLMI